MKNVVNISLKDAKNIGTTIEKRLNSIGVFTLADLAEITPVNAYLAMKEQSPNETLPLCYYLYSLQGALMDLDWEELPVSLKDELKKQVK